MMKDQQLMAEFERQMEAARLFDMNYDIVEVIHESSHATVYKVKDHNGQFFVAKKIPYSEVDSLKEYQLLKEMTHPSLPTVYNIYPTIEANYIVLEYIHGETLYDRIQDQGPLSQVLAVRYLKQLLAVVEFLHDKGVIHRDIKPHNIMLVENSVYLIDFDAARIFKEESGTDTMIVGTRGYAAPEQYGYHQSDFKADIYALGATFHFMLTGKTLEEDQGNYIKEGLVGRKVRKLLAKATAFNPKDRYAGIRQLRRGVEGLEKDRLPVMVMGGLIALILMVALSSWIRYKPKEVSVDKEPEVQSMVTHTAPETRAKTATVIQYDGDKAQQIKEVSQQEVEAALAGEAPINFADSGFEALIRHKLDRPEGPIYFEETRRIERLEVVGIKYINSMDEWFFDIGEPMAGEDMVKSYTMKDGTEKTDRGRIKTLDDLVYVPNLITLSILKNELRDLEGLNFTPNLVELHLIDNHIEDVSAIGATSVVVVYLDGNNIRDIGALAEMAPRLQVFSAPYNAIEDMTALETAESLTALDLRHNDLTETIDVAHFKQLTVSAYKVYTGNPGYR